MKYGFDIGLSIQMALLFYCQWLNWILNLLLAGYGPKKTLDMVLVWHRQHSTSFRQFWPGIIYYY